MLSRILNIIFLVYIAYSQYLINGYEKMNDRLQRVNDNLLRVCSNSKIDNMEKQQYK